MSENKRTAAEGEAPAVVLKDVGVSRGRYDILHEISCEIPSRRQTVIIGPNGAGKSTLVYALLGEVEVSGSVRFNPAKPVIGYVPQRLDFDHNLPLTVSEFMALGRSPWPLWLRIPKKVKKLNREYLEMVKAGTLMDRPLGSLSGGETQRVFLARALREKPDILILDEPASGVDVYGERLLNEILETFKREMTVIMVSHDLDTARCYADWIVCLNRTVVASGPPEEIFKRDVIGRLFGLRLEGGVPTAADPSAAAADEAFEDRYGESPGSEDEFPVKRGSARPAL
ncbi:MAG: metal ABC transporter ATP-binding protein [Deltaproteobacteria bacterium]|jgi:zinc transport system ATP-binding protein|nr:metal ABC transporter ATP-binding protein [Deltaproteobacteria bacterium]